MMFTGHAFATFFAVSFSDGLIGKTVVYGFTTQRRAVNDQAGCP